ncbi:FumA C-terminus/TtdB family hydratase beta subunit [Methanothermobacter tenebrarum]|uniref:Fumarate hydratase n=1 Tax=Methanothermobacter tenebrarum TaxID=680118 RepID=A0A328PBQ1_9EURY|nr:FumA C-terminus/TtdB family hydratase beta subunit [Methanothermobacter tenebrarum]MBC7117826.1 fumarate hydratase C-terminal domain-containing protein [Methanobacteriaceae archaeon]NPV64236.1 fumarate hydratase [Methanobacteriaceae archaeon]RAO79849.1 fumarate hydratase [Methanothermobacter tenebrarum]
MEAKLKTPLSDEDIKKLRIGDVVYISGTIFTARDRAHKKMIKEGAPYKLEGTVIFHAGPIIKQKGPLEGDIMDDPPVDLIVVGPTTSTRMNPYQSKIINLGVKAIIGKGGMDKNVQDALTRKCAVYLAAVGGCAALYGENVKKVKRVYWPNLGIPEAIWELEVQEFGPLLVAMDSKGENLYERVKC